MKHTIESKKAISNGRLNKVIYLVECKICSLKFRVNPSKYIRNKMFFCSRLHRSDWLKESGKWVSDKNPKFKIKQTLRCKFCLKDFIKTYQRKTFCTQTCAAKYGFSKDRNPRWAGGVSKYRDQIKGSELYKTWRKSVFYRDKWICQECGHRSKKSRAHKDKSSDIEAHHIMPWSKYPKLTFKIWNGITLCKPCHDKTYSKEEQFEIKYFKKTLNDYTPSTLRKLRRKI